MRRGVIVFLLYVAACSSVETEEHLSFPLPSSPFCIEPIVRVRVRYDGAVEFLDQCGRVSSVHETELQRMLRRSY